ncbi:MACD2 deacetylase, partial [Upupa epops]|nr:MACD2 deacetylase [Upupa epops]
AFPCISTGIYGFPNEPAAVIALNTIKEWLSKNHNEVDRIIFCVFLEVDYKIFKKKMGEFFPLDDTNEGGTELSEETGGLEQKEQPPSPTKSKGEQPEDLQDDGEDGGSGEVKQNPEDLKAQIQAADETKPSAAASLSSEEERELSEDKDSLKDSTSAQESDPVPPVGCEQEQAKEQDVSEEEEMKTGASSQSPCMEIEEPLLKQEDKTEVETPLIHGAKEKEEGQEEEGGGVQGKTGTSAEPMEVDLTCEAANVSDKDAEMNSQVENINDPKETEREA